MLNKAIPGVDSFTRCPLCLNFVKDGTIHDDCPYLPRKKRR